MKKGNFLSEVEEFSYFFNTLNSFTNSEHISKFVKMYNTINVDMEKLNREISKLLNVKIQKYRRFYVKLSLFYIITDYYEEDNIITEFVRFGFDKCLYLKWKNGEKIDWSKEII